NVITKQQLYGRWDALSDTLREAITSDVNSQLVWKTAENEHLSEEKIAVVSRLVGYVLMGFAHPEELANEIKDSLGIDARIAAAIAEPINRKIFQPIQESLEEIYAPAGEEPHAPKPIVLEEIIKPAGTMPEPKKETVPIPAPAPFPGAARTFVPASAPKITTAATPPASPIPAPSSKPVGRQLPVNMFSKMSAGTAVKPIQEKTPEEKPVVSPAEKQIAPPVAQEKTAEEPMPFILHQESESEPISPVKSSFKVGLSQEQFGKMEQKWAPPPRPAQIETSTAEEYASKTSSPSQRVVHYGDMKTPLPPAPPKKVQPSEESENPFEVLRRTGNNSK
ncbi:MAG TPA: hypothetical protein VMV71_01680, partial [Candidatus Paceibacterota bacterium]|nr:hypothetical protein [Candidatus Paceibacterota bacterium]